jgi:hypothetical protein
MSKFKKSIFLFLYLSIACLFSGCDSFDKGEPIPAYIHIPGFTFTTKTDGTQGSDAQQITDAWVYADKQLVGVFEVPVTIPVLKSGNTEITIFAGIKKNGLVSSRVTYPFFTGFTQQTLLTPEEIDTIKPSVTYKEGVQFAWIEDFEDLSVSLQKTGNRATIDSIAVTSDPLEVFQYNGLSNRFSGKVAFQTAGIFEHAGISSYRIPKQTDVYLEVNYKSDVNVQFGFLAEGVFTSKVPVVLGFPTNNGWNKLYIGLTEDWNVMDYADARMRIYMEAINNNVSAKPVILMDNLKLVHF